MASRPRSLSTIVYVDGYNLYYSALTKSEHKWLDLHVLMERILIDAYPHGQGRVEHIKFFSAPILGKYASDPESPNRQQRYHNALKFAPSGPTEIIGGYHSEVTKKARPLDPELLGRGLVRVNVVEEKQTDVNISLHMYRDAARSTAEQLVLVSNDSDLAPALEMIAVDFPHIVLGVVFPTIARESGVRQSGQLQKWATWTRRHLKTEELAASQLPRAVLNRKRKAITRPLQW